MTEIAAFFASTYGKLAAVLGGIGVIWAGVKTIREIRKWLKDTADDRRARREAPNKLLALIQQMKDEQHQKDEAQQEQLNEIKSAVDGLNTRFDTVVDKLDGVDMQVGTMQNEKMNWAYVYYGIEHHPIPLATLTSLEMMYDQYVATGKHNHVPQDFKERLRTTLIKGSKTPAGVGGAVNKKEGE